ncbi:MAG: alpha/beta hydrolase family protein [Candidatus Limnocylindria bacterium]
MAGREEELRFTAGDVTLAGTLTLPDSSATQAADRRGRPPGVLLLPSWYPRDRDGDLDRRGHPRWFDSRRTERGLLARVAEALARQGVASLRYDKRGCRASAGAWEAADWFTLVDDARDAIGFIRSRRELDLARTGIVGHGEGAAIALSVAIGDPAVGALTLVGAAARSFRDVFRRQVAVRRHRPLRDPLIAALDRWSEDIVERADRREESFELSVRTADGGVTVERVPLSLVGWHEAFHTPPLALATMLHRSVTLVHGESDSWVPVAEVRILERTLRDAGNEPSLRVIPTADHDLREAADAVIDDLAADMAARLVPRALPPVLLAIDEDR